MCLALKEGQSAKLSRVTVANFERLCMVGGGILISGAEKEAFERDLDFGPCIFATHQAAFPA